MVTNVHKLVLRSGRFDSTTRNDLAAAFDAFRASPQKDVLAIHFHGGLVNQANADGIADRLLDTYMAAGSYPLFVIWQSGMLETLRNNWREIVMKDLFDNLAWISMDNQLPNIARIDAARIKASSEQSVSRIGSL